MGFKALSISAHILQTLEAQGYSIPTPIQAAAIPHILAGKDVMGVAQTGTGKTAAFALPIIQRLLDPAHKIIGAGDHPSDAHNVAKTARKIRALILSPTRELASQIEESFKTYGQGTSLRQTVLFGGVSSHWQIKALFHGVDILVATPGRLLDLMGQGYVDLRYVQTLVLDEADQMLDMGFIAPIRQIVSKIPAKRQSLMFSATMPTEIRKLADTILRNPETVQVSPIASTVVTIDQSVYFVDKGAKPSLLVKYLNDNGITRALVFTRTKHGADKVSRYLEKSGIRAAALHGNKSQGQRRRAMEAFTSQRPPVMVATDVAARGLDIDNVSHVINYDLPNIPESYVHRIGRTGRAGASGFAVSFCDPEERTFLRDIERLTKQSIRAVGGHVAAPSGTHQREDHRPAARPHPVSHPRPAHAPVTHKPAAAHALTHKPAAHAPTHTPAAQPQHQPHPQPVGGRPGHRRIGENSTPPRRQQGGFKANNPRPAWGAPKRAGHGGKPSHPQNRGRFGR
jgi:ATP-dependent RNA helicase RhlE